MGSAECVFIDRDNVVSLITDIGENIWGEAFNYVSLKQIGIQYRCCFCVDGNSSNLDLFFKKDGSVTLKPVGVDSKYAEILKERIVAVSFKNEHENATCRFDNISDETYSRLTNYLESSDRITIIENKEVETPQHRHLKFSSSFGDKLVINRYKNGTLLFQGNPAYILTQAMYFMSKMPEVSEEDISKTQSEIYQIPQNTVLQARAKLKERIPNAYEKLDEVTLKVLSPAISLSNSPLVVEEYSCYVFPALKALEAQLLTLLDKKGIYINPPTQNFGSVFNKKTGTDEHILTKRCRRLINNATYEECVERIYDYLKKERHTRFHVNQQLQLTSLITDKVRADAILDEVLNLIDETAKKIM